MADGCWFSLIFNYYAPHGGWVRVPDPPPSWSTSSQELILSNYGHTQVKPPHPVRSAQLNTWWQSQYYGGGPHGNTLCCNFFFFFSFFLHDFAAGSIVQVRVRKWSGPSFWITAVSLLITTVSLLITTVLLFITWLSSYSHPNRALPTLPAPASSALLTRFTWFLLEHFQIW